MKALILILCIALIHPQMAEAGHESLEILISEQEITVANNEKTLNDAKERLVILKNESKSSWNSAMLIEDAEREKNDAEDILKKTGQRLADLLDEKRQEEERHIALDKRRTAEIINLRDQQSIDISKLEKFIGVRLSNTCVTLIKNNIDVCPTYEELYQLDSSNESVSGKFLIDDGYYHRDSAKFKNSWEWYKYDNTPRIMIDPPAGMEKKIKMITIQPRLETYFLADDHKVDENTRTYHYGRYIDRCHDATMSADNWKSILPDTIYTMRIGCTISQFDNSFSEILSVTEIDIASTNYWKYKTWLEDTKAKCLVICKEY